MFRMRYLLFLCSLTASASTTVSIGGWGDIVGFYVDIKAGRPVEEYSFSTLAVTTGPVRLELMQNAGNAYADGSAIADIHIGGFGCTTTHGFCTISDSSAPFVLGTAFPISVFVKAGGEAVNEASVNLAFWLLDVGADGVPIGGPVAIYAVPEPAGLVGLGIAAIAARAWRGTGRQNRQR